MSRRSVVRELQASKIERKNMNSKLQRMAVIIRKGNPTQQQYDQLQRFKSDLANMENRLVIAETKMWIEGGQIHRATMDIASLNRKISILVERGVMVEEQARRSA